MVRTRAIVVTLTALTLAIAAVVAPRPSQAQYGGGMGGMMGGGGSYASFEKVMDYPVKVETNGGSATGTFRMGTINVSCDLGFYAIAAKKVKEVRFSPPAQPVEINYGQMPVEVPAVVVTDSGDEIRGRVQVQNWQVKTDLGTLTLKPMTLKSLTITGEPKEPDPPVMGNVAAKISKKAEPVPAKK